MPIQSRSEFLQNHTSRSQQDRVRKDLAKAFAENQSDVYVLTDHDFIRLWAARLVERGRTYEQVAEEFRDITGNTISIDSTGFQLFKSHGATALNAAIDGQMLSALAVDMRRSGNLLGAYHTAIRQSKTYVIFQGHSGLRKVFTGTRYLATHTKVIKMGIGIDGAKAMARSGALVTIVFSVGLNGIQWIFDERFGWSGFLGNVSSDVVKGVLSIGAAYLVQSTLAAGAAIAVFPVAMGLVVGIGVGVVLYSLDDHLRLTDKLITANARYYGFWTAAAASSARSINGATASVKQKTEKYFFTVILEAGDVVVEIASEGIKRMINEMVRKSLSPTWLRF